MASLEDQQALLLYRVGPVLCCSPSYTVLSIIQPVPLTHPPGADATRPGIFRHSGHVVKTEELRVRFGVDEANRKPGRMIIAEVDSGRTAFWVDDIIDVISMPGTGWGQLPPHLPRGIFSRTLLLNDKIYLYADFDALQKLQGHGLLKTYIEQLLEQKDKTATPDTPGQTTTSVTVATTQAETNPEIAKTTTLPPTRKDSVETTPTMASQSPSRPGMKTTATDKTTIGSTTTTPPVRSAPAVHENKHPPASRSLTPSSVQNRPAATERNPVEERPVKSDTRKSSNVRNENISFKKTAKRESKPAPAQSTQPTTVTPAQHQARHDKARHTEPENGFPWAGLFLFVLLLSGSGAGIYFYIKKPAIPTSVSEDSITLEETYSRPTYSTYNSDNTSTPADEAPSAVETEPSPPIAAEPETIKASANAAITEKSSSDYQARIEQDDEGITIVIKAPREETALKVEITPPTDNSAAETTTPPDDNTPPPVAQTETVNPTPQPQREEIIHIVVKGDTLWHIARRYVNNPFRYPELARLSNIKNPDLIYPGNRVRIIREFN